MILARDSIAFATLAFLVLAPAGAMRQSADSDASQQKALEALEQRWLAAEDDPSALETILADDFVHVLPMGFVSKREQIDFMRSHPPPKDGTTRRFDKLRVRVFGIAGVVTGIVVATAPDGKTQQTAFTDVFAFRNGRWQAVNAQELPLGAPARR
ncbi:MAG TPA: nuclear transport factor 2 family protein [Vicinamibacterales bacterium]